LSTLKSLQSIGRNNANCEDDLDLPFKKSKSHPQTKGRNFFF
jgi:hypothetical protein